MKVLVTGANGMLGQDLCPVLEDAGCFVIEADRDLFDITDENQVNEILETVKPDLLVHCAAYTDVDGAEDDFETANLTNALATEFIAKACNRLGTTLVYISTDYVFDGEKQEPYLPDDLPNPINNYGKTKLAGEEAVKKYCEKHYIARTSWLYGSYGKNFVETMFSLSKKSELKVVDNQIGCPTWTVELALGIVKLLNKPYGTYHICGTDSVSWYGFAKEIFALANLEVNLKPCTDDEFPRKAKRPRYSVLENPNNMTFCRHWKLALKDYINLREI